MCQTQIKNKLQIWKKKDFVPRALCFGWWGRCSRVISTCPRTSSAPALHWFLCTVTSRSLSCNWSELLGRVLCFQNRFESLLRKRNLDGDSVYCRDNPKVSKKGSGVILLSHSPNLSKWLAGFIALDAWDTRLWLVCVSGEVIVEPEVARGSIITSQAQGGTGRVNLYCIRATVVFMQLSWGVFALHSF